MTKLIYLSHAQWLAMSAQERAALDERHCIILDFTRRDEARDNQRDYDEEREQGWSAEHVERM